MNYNDPLQRDEPITIHTDEEKDSVIIRGRTSTAKFVNFLHALPEGVGGYKKEASEWFSEYFGKGWRSGQAFIVISNKTGQGAVGHWDGCYGQQTLRRVNRLIKNDLHYAEGMTTLCLELWSEAEDTDDWYNLALTRAHTGTTQDGEETIEVEI